MRKSVGHCGRMIPAVVFLHLAMAGNADAIRPKIGFNGAVNYSDNNSKTDIYSDSQNASVGLTQNLTPILLLQENVRYARINKNEDGKITTIQNLYPDVSLILANDFFQYDLGANINESLQNKNVSKPPTTSTWQTSFASAWKQKRVPDLQLSYTESRSTDERTPRAVDSLQKNLQGSTGLALGFARLNYSYSLSNDLNNISRTEQQNEGHFARLSAAKSFLDNRLSTSFSQQYNYNVSTFTAEQIASGVALRSPTTQFEARAGTQLDNNLDWDDLTLPFPAPVLTQRYNIAIKTGLNQTDRIYLYTDVALSAAEAAGFQWSLYSNSSLDGTSTWKSLGNQAFTYDEVLQRFEFTVSSLKEQYLMLVESSIDAPNPVNFMFTKVETAQNVATAGVTELETLTKSSRQSSSAGIGFQAAQTLRFAYSLNYETSKSESSDEAESMSNQVSMDWHPWFFKSLQLGLNERRDDPGDDKKYKTQGCSLAVTPIMPLPSLDMSLTASRSTSFDDGRRTATDTSFGAVTKAALYKHLTSSLNLSYSTNETPGEMIGQSFNSALQLTSRLTPTFTGTMEGRHSFSRSASYSYTQGIRTNFSWRASDMLSLGSGFVFDFPGEAPDRFSYNFSLALAMSPKTRLSLAYSYANNGDSADSHGVSSDWFWNINRHFTYKVTGSYSISSIGRDENWSILNYFVFNY